MLADAAACARALVHTRTLAHAHVGTRGLPDMVPLRQTRLTDFLPFRPMAGKVPAHQDLAARNDSPHLATPTEGVQAALPARQLLGNEEDAEFVAHRKAAKSLRKATAAADAETLRAG